MQRELVFNKETEQKVTKFSSNMGKDKDKNKTQKECGVRFTDKMKDFVSHLSLNNTHINFSREEITLINVRINYGWGIKALKQRIKEHEYTHQADKEESHFQPKFMTCNNCAENEKITFEIKFVSYSLGKKHLIFAQKKLSLRKVEYEMREGIQSLIKNKKHEN